MLDVMEELDPERRHPPEVIDLTREAAAQSPEADQHNHGIPIVERLGLDERREEDTQGTTCFRDRPPEHVYLKSLQKMFNPVREHDHHEQAERQLVPVAVQPFDECGGHGAKPPSVQSLR